MCAIVAVTTENKRNFQNHDILEKKINWLDSVKM
jgi:hypothetical protein